MSNYKSEYEDIYETYYVNDKSNQHHGLYGWIKNEFANGVVEFHVNRYGKTIEINKELLAKFELK